MHNKATESIKSKDLELVRLPQEELTNEIRSTCKKILDLSVKAFEFGHGILQESSDERMSIVDSAALANMLGPFLKIADHIEASHMRSMYAELGETLTKSGARKVNIDVK